jgi:hypothetical protein
MPTALQTVNRFVAGLIGKDIDEVVLNPLELQIGSKVKAYGLDHEDFVVETISEIDIETEEENFRTVDYGLRPVGEVGGPLYHLRMCPLKSVTEGEWEHDCALLLAPDVDVNRGYSIELEDALDEDSDIISDKVFGGPGVTYDRLGTDRSGHECEVFQVQDTDADGKAERSEALYKSIRQWAFFRRVIKTVAAADVAAMLADPSTEPQVTTETTPTATAVSVGTGTLEFLFIELDHDNNQMTFLRGRRVPLATIETY